MIDTASVKEIIKKYHISEYSVDGLKNAFKSIGFRIEDRFGRLSKSYFEILDISPKPEENCFSCNCEVLKIVFVNDDFSSDILCFQLSFLLYLCDAEDTRFCSNDEKLDAVTFAVFLKNELDKDISDNKLLAVVKKHAAVAVSAIVAVLAVISGFLFLGGNDKIDNPLEKANISSSYTTAVAENENQILAKDAFAALSTDDIDIDEDTTSDINAEETVTESSDEYKNEPLDSDANGNDTASTFENVGSSDTTVKNDEVLTVPIEDVAGETPETEQVTSDNTTYYVTKSGKKYHVKSCSYLKDLSKCTEISPTEAATLGYEPCKRCI